MSDEPKAVEAVVVETGSLPVFDEWLIFTLDSEAPASWNIAGHGNESAMRKARSDLAERGHLTKLAHIVDPKPASRTDEEATTILGTGIGQVVCLGCGNWLHVERHYPGTNGTVVQVRKCEHCETPGDEVLIDRAEEVAGGMRCRHCTHLLPGDEVVCKECGKSY